MFNFAPPPPTGVVEAEIGTAVEVSDYEKFIKIVVHIKLSNLKLRIGIRSNQRIFH